MVETRSTSLVDVLRAAGERDPFYRALADICEMHARKSADYGATGDPHANIRASEEYGIPAWVGALVRQNDKFVRIKQYLRRGTLTNESLRDSMIDQAVYGVIALAEFDRAELRRAAGVTEVTT